MLNYKDNRGQITGTLDNSPLYNNLQNELVTKTSADTPVLMMPLRLETRFMRVTKNLLDDMMEGPKHDVIQKSDALKAKSMNYNMFNHFDSQKAFAASTSLNEDINELKSALLSVTGGNFMEKDAMSKTITELDQSLNEALSHLIGNTDDPDILASVEDMNSSTQTAISEMHTHIGNMELDNSWEGEFSLESTNYYQFD